MKKLILVVLIFSGCGSIPLTEGENNVRILRKSDAPATCQERGKVVTNPYKSMTDQDADNELKRLAFALGGNTVTIDSESKRMFSGTSYSCN